MFIIVLGQHVSILIESSSGPSKKIYPYLETFKLRCRIPNAYIIYVCMYVCMHVYVCMYVYMYVRMYVCLYVCV